MVVRFQRSDVGFRVSRIGSAALALVLLAGLLFALAACSDDEDETPEPTATTVASGDTTDGQTPAVPTEPADNTPAAGGPDAPPPIDGEVTETASGITIIDYEVVPGAAVAETGKTLTVHTTGWLADGTKFYSSLDDGEPLVFMLGVGDVIAGWDEGLVGMTVGSKRRLIIPPELAYGEDGRPPSIPPNAELTFDVELLDVE